LFTVTTTRDNRCGGFYRQGVGSFLESVIMYAVEVAAEHAVAADITVPKKYQNDRHAHCCACPVTRSAS
jgi:hypothetical protein